MNKVKKKRSFKLLGIGCMSLLLGLSACSSSYQVEDHYENNIQEKANVHYLSVDSSSYTIVYDSNDDLYDYDYWINIYNSLLVNNNGSANAISVTGTLTISSSDWAFTKLYATDQQDYKIIIFSTDAPQMCQLNLSTNSCVWSNYMGGQVFTATYLSITSEDYYNIGVLPPTPIEVVTDSNISFIGILLNGLNSLANGIASGVVSMATYLFLNVDSSTGAVTGLSTFGGILALFVGLALAIGITTRVYLWITRLGRD